MRSTVTDRNFWLLVAAIIKCSALQLTKEFPVLYPYGVPFSSLRSAVAPRGRELMASMRVVECF